MSEHTHLRMQIDPSCVVCADTAYAITRIVWAHEDFLHWAGEAGPQVDAGKLAEHLMDYARAVSFADDDDDDPYLRDMADLLGLAWKDKTGFFRNLSQEVMK